MQLQSNGKFVGIAAIGGVVLLLIGTLLHPMHADPNVPLAAFAEYAADRHWIASHLIQLAGVVLMLSALLIFFRQASGETKPAATLGSAGAIASMAVAGALQAVDGIALKAMVDVWAAAPEQEKAALFHAVFAVRQIEAGLASIGSLLFGATVSTYGIALLSDARTPKWLGVVALAGGVPMAIAGLAIAYTGFSELAMTINMPASVVVLFWIVALGWYAWQYSAERATSRESVTDHAALADQERM